MRTTILQLMSIDMLRQRDHWKATWNGLKDKITRLTAHYPAERMRQWLMYWDHQMYKVRPLHDMRHTCMSSN